MLKGITYASLGMLAVSSSLWAMYMQDNAFVIMSLLFGPVVTIWQIHLYKVTIPSAVNFIAITTGIVSALGFVVRDDFSNLTKAFLSFGTAGALIAYVGFAVVVIINSRLK